MNTFEKNHTNQRSRHLELHGKPIKKGNTHEATKHSLFKGCNITHAFGITNKLLK